MCSRTAGPRPMKLRAGTQAPHAKGVEGKIMIQEAFTKGARGSVRQRLEVVERDKDIEEILCRRED